MTAKRLKEELTHLNCLLVETNCWPFDVDFLLKWQTFIASVEWPSRRLFKINFTPGIFGISTKVFFLIINIQTQFWLKFPKQIFLSRYLFENFFLKHSSTSFRWIANVWCCFWCLYFQDSERSLLLFWEIFHAKKKKKKNTLLEYKSNFSFVIGKRWKESIEEAMNDDF